MEIKREKERDEFSHTYVKRADLRNILKKCALSGNIVEKNVNNRQIDLLSFGNYSKERR